MWWKKRNKKRERPGPSFGDQYIKLGAKKHIDWIRLTQPHSNGVIFNRLSAEKLLIILEVISYTRTYTTYLVLHFVVLSLLHLFFPLFLFFAFPFLLVHYFFFLHFPFLHRLFILRVIIKRWDYLQLLPTLWLCSLLLQLFVPTNLMMKLLKPNKSSVVVNILSYTDYCYYENSCYRCCC